ncbi:MAG: hypothetical protein OXN86_03220 [Chloroflexota bacterium]|nr:hypothetical protein [Chloroflexota bacterium]
MSAESTPQAIRNRYWELANSGGAAYAQVRALDSLSRLLDLFPRPKHPAFFAYESEAMLGQIDPADRAAMALLPPEFVDEVRDAQIAAVEKAVAQQAEQQAAAEAAAQKAETDDADDDEDASNAEEDDPL